MLSAYEFAMFFSSFLDRDMNLPRRGPNKQSKVKVILQKQMNGFLVIHGVIIMCLI